MNDQIFRGNPRVDARPHSARVYDYLLGGKTHYTADTQAAEQLLATWPGARTSARANRRFMRRVTRVLAAEEGIRQFLDLGSGLPAEPNLHQVAQAAAPGARVLYADNDPIVLTYAEALLTGTREGRVGYLRADLRQPETVVTAPELHHILDMRRPVALCLLAVLHLVADEDDPYAAVAALVDALAPGSVVVITHPTPDFAPRVWKELDAACPTGVLGTARTEAEVKRFFTGLDLLGPGLVPAHRWRPDDPDPAGAADPAGATDADVSLYAGVARKAG
ncbi:SAM-dependent methyltransferase [Streptomyces sp. B1866]|uniref:SAM-dependent methyltransferase n=1 Tax=Streptomyces sp. B1866 TaxID=3075431 RepID=UPI0028927636|nr:SAM-dependent methyltransferase [Streptomyces sp. B1866]MDT3400263.1 SAM-dependent methyltransferase [Streptomyces sp. B1866]